MTVDVKYVVELDARAANAALATLHSRASTVPPALAAVNTKLQQTEAYSSAAAKQTLSFAERAKGAQGVMGPAAAAVGGLSGSLSLMGGSAGKAAAGMGAVAGALGSGSPLVIGIALAATAIAGLITLYQGAKKAQAEFAKSAVGVGVRFSSDAASAARDVQAALESSDPVDRARSRLADTTSDAQVVVDAEDRELARVREARERSRLDAPLAFVQGADAATAEVIRLQVIRANNAKLTLDNVRQEGQARLEIVEIEKMRAGVEKANADARARNEALPALRQALRDGDDRLAGYDSPVANDDRLLAGDREVADLQRRAEEMQREDRLEHHRKDIALAVALAADEKTRIDEAAKGKLEAQRMLDDEEYRMAEAQSQRLAEVRNAQNELYVNGATGAFSTIVGAGDQLAKDLVMQQEFAAEMAAASVLSGIGQQLVGLGTKAMIEGTLISLNPLTPGLGVPLLVAGGAAIAAGIGMGAGGAAISANIGGRSSGASREQGVNRPRPGSGASTSSGGNGVNLTINYGVAGPASEDTAREIGRVMRVGERRGEL